MRNFGVLLLKEERALFSSPIAYVLMTAFLLIMGYSFTLTLFISHQPSLVHIFFQMFVLFMLTAPLITMRLLAEERKLRTLEVLLTAPVSEIEIVLAKFVASMSLIVIMLLLSGSYAIVLSLFGDPDLGPIYSGYLGLLLFGSAVVGVGYGWIELPACGCYGFLRDIVAVGRVHNSAAADEQRRARGGGCARPFCGLFQSRTSARPAHIEPSLRARAQV